MDKDKLKHRIEVMTAALGGRRIQLRCRDAASTVGMPCWEYTPDPAFDWNQSDYRVEPEAKRVPLAKADLPAICWLRNKGLTEIEHLVIRRSTSHVVVGADTEDGRMVVTYQGMFRSYEYSESGTEGSWRPCSKEAPSGQ